MCFSVLLSLVMAEVIIITKLTAEMKEHPQMLHDIPRFGWRMVSDITTTQQPAYVIELPHSLTNLLL